MKAFILFILLSFVLLTGALGSALSAEASEARLVVLSHYRDTEADSMSSVRRWIIASAESLDGSRSLKFFADQTPPGAPLCELTVTPEEGGTLITWRGKRKGRAKTTSDGFMVLPGYPVPCDILPSKRPDGLNTFQDRVAAGERVFVKRYSISYQDVTRAEAIKQGWLAEESGQYPAFHMRLVVDDHDNLVVRQLWPEGGRWWMYEETPFRQSWLLDE